MLEPDHNRTTKFLPFVRKIYLKTVELLISKLKMNKNNSIE